MSITDNAQKAYIQQLEDGIRKADALLSAGNNTAVLEQVRLNTVLLGLRPTNSGASSQLQGADDRLSLAIDWINRSPHGDNCYVSDHYEGDPGNRCNCGKDAILAHLESDVAASKPMCRDCADFGPICPNSGKPCAPPQAPSQPEAEAEVFELGVGERQRFVKWIRDALRVRIDDGRLALSFTPTEWQSIANALASPAPGSLPVPETKVEPSQCCGHPENCDYGSLGICAPVVLVDKSPKTQRPLVDKTEDLQGAIETLRSIAANTCCDGCQEAARVAKSFLSAHASTPPSPPLGEEKL